MILRALGNIDFRDGRWIASVTLATSSDIASAEIDSFETLEEATKAVRIAVKALNMVAKSDRETEGGDD